MAWEERQCRRYNIWTCWRYSVSILMLLFFSFRNDISDLTSASEVLVKLERLILVLREWNTRVPHYCALLFCHRQPKCLSEGSFDRKKERVNNFFVLLSRERNGFPYLQGWGSHKWRWNQAVFFIAVSWLFSWSCRQRPSTHLTWCKPDFLMTDFSCELSSISKRIFQDLKLFEKLPYIEKKHRYKKNFNKWFKFFPYFYINCF